MKKLLAILVVFALFTSTAFAADIFWGGWGRANFVPVRVVMDGAADDTNIYSGTEVGWDSLPSFGIEFKLDGGEIGFFGKMSFEASDWGGGVGVSEQVYTWWKPLDAFQLTVGLVYWDVLRGAGGAESFAGYANGGSFGEDAIFSRFNTVSKLGAVLQITPLENLYVGAAIRTGAGPGTKIDDVFKYSQYALGYDIPGIGFARVGYFGNNSQAMQVAFKLTAVEALNLDFGFTYKTDSQVADAYLNTIQVNLVADFAISDAFKVWFGVNGEFGGDWEKQTPGSDPDWEPEFAKLQFGINPSFSLDFGTIGVGFYIGFPLVDDAKASLGFDLYIEKSVGGGSIKAGVAVAIDPQGNDKNKVTFAIPIEITYSIY